MPTFISDPVPAVYLFWAAALIGTAAVAAQRQDRKSGVTFLSVAVLFAVLFLLDRFIDSPREEAVKNAQAMAAAADTNNPDEFVKHVADPFVYYSEGPPRTVTRSELKSSQFWPMLRQFNVHVAVWSFSRGDVKVIDENTIEIGFLAKGESRNDMKGVPLYIRATYKRQSDGTMKLSEFRTFDAVNHEKPFTIPNFP